MNMCPTNKCKTAPESCLKGQVFFIWTSCSSAETLKNRISLLGGKVEQFLSKDVTTVLVEDNQLLVPELLSPELSVKSTYAVNGTVVASFPYPGGLTNIPSTSSGYNFIAANTSSKPFSPYRIICYARQWGIQVLGIAEFLTWTEPQIKSVIHRQKQRKPPENVSNLTGYFIKFESVNKNYRPCYKMFNNDPDRLLPIKNASVLASVLVPETCNVILSNPVSSKQLNFSHMDTFVRPTHQVKPNVPVKANEKKAQNNKLRPKEENNYCECCKTHFADFRQHIKSSKHQSFVSNEKNYESVHNILKMLPTPQEFIENLQNPSPNADSGLTNGDVAHCLSGANVPDAEVSAQLHLQVRKDNITGTVMPVIVHPERNVLLPQNFQMPKDEVMPLPLDLHIKREDEVKNEVIKIKQEPDVYVDVEQIDLLKKEEINSVQPKLEANNDLLLENVKVEEKQPVGLLDGGQCDEGNGGGDFLDRNNTAALAQLCLKNFDSYWLDSLPCEVDDMVFDDIFDFDDAKAKPDENFVEPFGENTDVPHTPGLVSGISTPNLKTQNTDNTSLLMNTSIDVKDLIKVEPPDLESLPPTCSMGKENEAGVSSQSVAVSLNESQPKDKKAIFSIASYCTDKVNIEPTPSCSTAMSSKNPELLFSDESSDDDENGNVLISNALHFITNSDTETKIGKESEEEDDPLEESLEKVFSLQNDSVRKTQMENKVTSAKEAQNPIQIVQSRCKETSSSLTPKSPVSETDLLNNNTLPSKSKRTGLFHKTKVDSLSGVGTSRINVIQSSVKDPAHSEKIRSKSKSSKSGSETPIKAPAKAPSSDVPHLDKLKVAKTTSKPTVLDTNNLKSYQETPKEDASSTKEKEWDYTCNKIYKKYPIPLNRTSESMKISDERKTSKECARLDSSNITPQKSLEEKAFSKSSNDKYPNPKKNISLREKIVKKNNSEVSSNPVSVASLEKGNWPVTAIANPGLPAESMMMEKGKSDLKTKPILTGSNVVPANEGPCDLRIDQVYYESTAPAECFPPKGREYHSGLDYPTDLSMNSSVLDASSSQQAVSWENKMNPYSYGSITPVKHSQLQERNKQDFKESSKGKGSSYVPRTNFASVDSIVSDDRYFGNPPEPVTPTKSNEFPKDKDHSRTFSFKKHYMKQNQYLNTNIVSANAVSVEENLNPSKHRVVSSVQNSQAPFEKIVSGETPISETKAAENVTATSNALQVSLSSQSRVAEDEAVISSKDLQSQVSSTDKTSSSPEKKDRSTDSNTSIASAVSTLTENTLFSPRHDFVPTGKSSSQEESVSTVINDCSEQLQPPGATVSSLSGEKRLQPELYAEDLSMKQVNVPQKKDKNLGSAVTPSTLQEGSSCTISNNPAIQTSGVAISSLPGEDKLHQAGASANNPQSVQATVHKNAEKSASATNPGISKDKNSSTPANSTKIKLRTTGGVMKSVLVENRLQPPAENVQPKQANVQRKSAEKLGSVTNTSCNASTLSCFKKVHNNFEHFIPFKRKRAYRKDKKAHKKIKKDPSSLKKLNTNEGVRNDAKEKSPRGSINPCQYSYRTAKYNVDNSSNSTSVKFTSLRRTVKIPPKEKSQKLRELPPLWTVSVNGVKLKFTRIYPKKVDAYQYVTEDDSD